MIAPELIAAAERTIREIADLTAGTGRAVRLDPVRTLDRSDAIDLAPPTQVSPNGRCRLLPAADGWIAINLPRPDDLDLAAALIERSADDLANPWPTLATAVAGRTAGSIVADAARLGLAAAILGERRATASRIASGPGPDRPARVLDLSSLWAGPLSGGIFAAAGHDVLKVESRRRPDPTPRALLALDARLNGAKRRRSIDFTADSILALIATADVVITSARPRAFDTLGIDPAYCLRRNPALVWIAITGHGWRGDAGLRIGFGDDAAVAGGLVDWDAGGPRFLGDAVADPLTGLAAAAAGLRALGSGTGGLIDIALAQVAADASAAR